MKRSLRFLVIPSVALTSLAVTATPALAQYDSNAGDAIGFGILCCYGIVALFGLALFVLWIWMLIDAFQRQEYEYPNSSGNTKTIWIVAMLVSWAISLYWIVAIAYYLMVYKKIKRGTVQPPSVGGYGQPAGGAGTPPPPPSPGGTPPTPPAPSAPPAEGGGTPPPAPPA